MNKKPIITISLTLILLSGCSPLYRVKDLSPSNRLKEVKFEKKAVNSTYTFYYSDTTKNIYLRKLRVDYGLNTIALNVNSELGKIKAILNWTNKQWAHSGSNTPSAPFTILKEAKEAKNFRCVEYGIVSSAALSSIGIPIRVLGLKKADAETVKYGAGHIVAESYSKDLKK